MKDTDMTWDNALEQVLDLFDGDGQLTDADIERMMADDEACRAVNEYADCKQAMQQRYGHRTPNVEDEWVRFMADKTSGAGTAALQLQMPYAADTQADDEPSFWQRHRQAFTGGLIGMAATLLLLFCFSWYKSIKDSALPEGIVVYETKDAPQEVRLQNGDDDAFAVDNDNAKGSPALVAAKGGTTLNYQCAANTSRPSTIQLLTTPVGKDYQVTLSDGTHVYLNADSRLEYPSRFEGNERVVNVEGEAYFDVAKDAKHPFIVRTAQADTRVLGTKFNVVSYSDKFTRVTLIEGAVNITNRKDGKSLHMKPGDEVVVDDNGKMTQAETDVDGYVYWQEDFFYFDNKSLSEIMQSIGKWYNVNVVFANEETMNYRFHFLCERKAGIDHAIKLLNTMKKLHITRNGETVLVK
jgi:transmembrane sensor